MLTVAAATVSPGPFSTGDAFTGEGTLIHRGPALRTVPSTNPAPGPHQDCVAHLDLGGGDFDLLSVSQDGGRLRRQVHKLANGVSVFPLAGSPEICPG